MNILIIDGNKLTLHEDEFIFIRDSNIVRRIKLNEILYAEATGDYVRLHTYDKFYAIHTTLKVTEEHLPAVDFIRVHRSYIVALSKIDIVQDGTLQINGTVIPIADSYRAGLNQRMNIL